MLGNVKNQMTNWIGGGIASLRKTSEGDTSTAASEMPPDSPISEASIKGSIKEKDDEDNSRCVSSAEVIRKKERERKIEMTLKGSKSI